MPRNTLRAIVTTVPFAEIASEPMQILQDAGYEVVINPTGKRLKADEVAGLVRGFDVIIAGTETITGAALAAAGSVRAICRVGIGVDGVDLIGARNQNIGVAYTPDGPSPAVAELTVGLMIDLLRGVGQADRGMRQGAWTRHNGRRIAESTVGVIGCGRIGRRVIAHLCGGFPGVKILAHDILGPQEFPYAEQVKWAGLEEIVAGADVITVHVPLTRATRGLIGGRELAAMQHHALLINTARGGIVDEAALAHALGNGRIAGAAIDVFEDEPYTGPLTRCDNILLTCHMGSMTRDCRLRMEIEAAEEAARFARGEPFKCPVPEAEYIIAADRAGYAG